MVVVVGAGWRNKETLEMAAWLREQEDWIWEREEGISLLFC